MEAYKIFASLNLKGDALEKMKLFSAQLKKATEQLTLLDRKLGTTNTKLKALSTGFVRVGDKSVLGLGKLNDSLVLASEHTASLTKQVTLLSEKIRTIPKMKNVSGSLAEGEAVSAMGGGRRGRGIHGWHTVGMGEQAATAGFIGSAASRGGLGLGAAAVGGYALYKGFGAEETRQTAMMQLKAQGFSPDSLKIADAFSKTQIKGVSSNDMLKAFGDAVMITKELPGSGYANSREMAPLLAKARFASDATFGKMSDMSMMNMARAAEIWGGSDHKKVMEGMNLMFQMMSSSAGTIDPTQQQQFLAQGAGAFGKLTPMGFLGLEPVLQEIKGRRAATGLITLQQQLQTGAGTLNNKKRVEDLLKLGIYQSAGFDKNGRPLHTTAKKEFTDLLSTDPFLFEEAVMKKYAAAGTTDDLDIQRRLSLDFGRTPGQELYLMHKNRDKIMRQRQLMGNFWGIDATYNEALGTNKGSSEALSKSFENFNTAVGRLTSPALIKMFDFLTAGLNRFALAIEVVSHAGETFGKIGGLASDLGHAAVNKILPTGIFPGHDRYQKVIKGDVYFDNKKMGRWTTSMMSDAINQSGTMGTTTGVTGSLTQQPSAITNFGN